MQTRNLRTEIATPLKVNQSWQNRVNPYDFRAFHFFEHAKLGFYRTRKTANARYAGDAER